MKNPVDAVIAVTYRCNSQCAMCNIWRMEDVQEVRPGAYRELPRSLKYINLTGGEPFLRSDLPEVVEQVHKTCPRANIVISTNGLMANALRDMMPDILKIDSSVGVAVSIDGIREVHDRIRGVKGAYGKARHCVNLLKRLGCKHVKIAFTASPDNIGHMSKVYEVSRDVGVEFTCAVAHCSEHYFQTADGSFAISPKELREQFEMVIKQELGSWSPKRWARACFMAGLLQFAQGGGRMLPCAAGVETVFVTPNGDVYPCNVFSAKMGNISEQTWRDLWRSEEAQLARERLTSCTHGCWMICSARMPMRRHPFFVLRWVLRHKFLPGNVD